ncbi:hypothetical protein FNJ88_02735 [Chryseobacterium sp. SNU WT5]|uniref:hypothetical protein n=1 Tax=Chryseobacterium sp. SNU WT5 TaxID=2594269 RepID=UPI001180814A|nr:hypothetical protein [Chryseobacterium sp. SNU WT5]QDP84523.1 hypothetical protein FNJ88_02735 [Chryseobacterium sp. SNU WT5]
MKNSVFILAVLALINCNKETTEIKVSNDSIQLDSSSKGTTDSTKPAIKKSEVLKNLNNAILSSLKKKDFPEFASFIHPERGIRFSMYAYVDDKKDKHFTKEEFLKYIPTNIKFTWGQQDGTGDPLIMSINNYLDQWVVAENFSNVEFHLNSFKGTGNSLNNLPEKYPGLDFIENYKAGSGESADFHWSALRFVFEELNGVYYLVGVVNDSWTI